MPRPERPLDPGQGALARWAADLQELRETAGGLGYRELARRAHFSPSTLSDAAGGQKLPSLAVTLGYVRACGGDTDAWHTRWHALGAELASAPDQPRRPDESGVSPYRGLATFQTQDADWFFGRTHLVRELTARIAAQRFVAVFGPSGSGKSSLLRAGILPALTRPDTGRAPWQAVVLTPGERPLAECAIHVARLLQLPAGDVLADLTRDPQHLHLAVRQALSDAPDDVDLVLVVDQLEELFTLCGDHTQRAAFIAALTTAAFAPGSRLRVVLGIRADFYGRCAEHPDLVDALRDNQVLVGAMLPEELRAAIIEPARRVGLTVEATLVSTILSEMVGRPGALPLMSHTLVETWRRRRGTTLSLTGYQASGGIDGAIQQTAEATYTALDTGQQHVAREILLRLTALDEDARDTRRRAPRAELVEDTATAEVLNALAAARLITVDEDLVEIAHEALIRSWSRLRDWLDQDREGLRLHRRLIDDARTWESLDRDSGALYRGVRLAAAKDWYTRRHPTLTNSERAFLDASRTAHEREHHARRVRIRRLWTLAASLAVATCVAAAAIVIAIQRPHAAEIQRAQALSRELAARATAFAGVQPDSAALALAAWATAPTAEARGAVLSTQSPTWASHRAPLPDAAMEQVVDSGPRAPADAISHNGQTTATGLPDGTIMLTDVHSGHVIATFTAANPQTSAAFSPDGHRLATRDILGTVDIWQTATGGLVAQLPAPVTKILKAGGSLAYSPDGRTLAVSTRNDVVLWDTTTWRTRSTLRNAGTLISGNNYLTALAFSPDSRTLAVALPESITLWDLATHRKTGALVPRDTYVDALAFSPDGHTLAAASPNLTIVLWRPADGQQYLTLNMEPAVTVMDQGGEFALSYNRDGTALTTYNVYTGNVDQWQTDPDTVVRQTCHSLYLQLDTITPEYWNQLAPGIPRPAFCRNH
jgi:energy-coupling factor transporter ATP-binding protein EcfA2